MPMSFTKIVAMAVISLPLSLGFAEAQSSGAGGLKMTEVVSGLDEPWGFAFLPGQELLITERDGALLHVSASGVQTTVKGAPKVRASGQGGLLDVMVPRDFAKSRQVFLSYSKRQRKGSGTALAVATLSPDGSRLRNLRDLFVMEQGSSGGRHFGSRLVEARDGTIFMTIGDRGDRDQAQNLASHNGTIVRMNRDGTVPNDNPFVTVDGAQPEIWSYGHRNPQGAALDLNGQLWVNEHGARGGDEVNKVRKGGNFGWPVIAYGRHYTGGKIGEGTKKAGMEQPAHFWDPSIAPSGMMIYSGKLWPEWRGDIFVGSLKFDYISRLEGSGQISEVAQIKSAETERVRDVREGPKGAIWFLSVGQGALYKIEPPA